VNVSSTKIAFIGAGNMARAILGGLLQKGFPASNIWASEPEISRLDDLKAQGVNVTDNNEAAVSACDVIILAVKPQILKDVVQPLASSFANRDKLIVSVAAGISSESIDTWAGGNQAIVRCMPNTPALVGMGASGLYANANVSAAQKESAEAALAAVGLAMWVEEEELLHAITAVSGSGPAYYFLFMESMIKAGIEQGLPADVAKQLTLQTARGAAEMAMQSDVEPDELRRRVTSPKGTTEQAILSFQANQLEGLVEKAMKACADRSVELSELLGK
jgi:pyrroline-5-carboxylate reductase